MNTGRCWKQGDCLVHHCSDQARDGGGLDEAGSNGADENE